MSDIEAALFATPPAVIVQARALIERERGETAPTRIMVTWLGIATALVGWHADGQAHALTVTGADADALHDAEGGTATFPVLCRDEHDVRGQTYVCRLVGEHWPIMHDDCEGTRWPS